jgi:hypothetical protein
MSIESQDNKSKTFDSPAPDSLLARVLAALNGIRFGSVELWIHEGRVVQIERRERLRLEGPANRGQNK